MFLPVGMVPKPPEIFCETHYYYSITYLNAILLQNHMIFPQKAAFTTIKDVETWKTTMGKIKGCNCVQTNEVVYTGAIIISFANARWGANG